MEDILWGLIIGFPIGLVLGLSIWCCCCLMNQKTCNTNIKTRLPIQVTGANLGTGANSDSTSTGQESPRTSGWSIYMIQWLEGQIKRKNVASACRIPNYAFKDLQSATLDFSTTIGKGAFGHVYKAHMETGETVAVKVLDENREPLRWDLRVQIALDVARGLEYLHYGAVPPVLHRNIKSSNILLDHSMRARVADFRLSRQEMMIPHPSKLRGTFGYLDPEYISTKKFTKKSDVYSFGVLLFELISGRNPQHGLMEYVELAAIDVEGTGGWEDVADTRLDGNFDVKALTEIATLAYKCIINPISGKRPSMRDIVQTLYWTCSSRNQTQKVPDRAEEPCFELDIPLSRERSFTELER
ncbi:hypothetical protein LWI28_017652 [Acer negundo]|uniref:Protein kinase domain-containing protein n=1 Tax=Acer negundo TaxID=4023 RepID=A0AAD5JFY0_ACENE|nr:hypothetical protein LWI28_017652 [Acer negundo]